ncbi:MAG: prepilin-type N-terminal cleavage/methylation domain-containing protein [Candidatus Saccharimonadales bacterium]
MVCKKAFTPTSLKLRRVKLALPAFTIVELLVVIVVIGILAAITIVSYNGITKRATTSAIQTDLINTKTQLDMSLIDNNAYPTTLDCSIPDSATNKCIRFSHGNVYSAYQINNTTNPQTFCLAVKSGNISMRISNNSNPSQGSCIDFSAWSIEGGISYDAFTDQISLTGSGKAYSPLVRVDNTSTATLTVESYATVASPYFSPQSGVHFDSSYYEADGVTPAYNSIGYTGNGNAQAIPLFAWTKRTWRTPTGPNVVYIRFRINSSPTLYTSNNLFRNPTITFE